MPIARKELKNAKTLQTKKGRKEQKRFMAEGMRLLEEALRHNFLPEKVFFAPSLFSRRGQAFIERMEKKNVGLCRVSARELLSVADTKTPQGIVGIFSIPQEGLAELYRPHHRKLLWCENISDPGNLGTLARSALAFGFKLMVVGGSSADMYSPKVIRASAGAIFGLAVARQDTARVLDFAREKEFAVLAAELDGKRLSRSVAKALKGSKMILAVGAEASGLPTEIIEKADLRIRVDHSGKVESLNAAVAGSIIMYSLSGL